MKKYVSSLVAATLALSLLGCTDPTDTTDAGSQTQPTESTPFDIPDPESAAADWLEAQLAAQDNILWVYRDDADGLNHFTQKSFMGDNYRNVPEMNEASEGQSGISGIAAELDMTQHSWGGYMFLNGTLEAGSSAPAVNDGQVAAGIDLTGAERLVFYAKGETGAESVEFFMGGFGWKETGETAEFADTTPKISLGTVNLAKEWKRYELSLKGADLSRVACGFGWVANDASNPSLTTVRFSIDDIRYEFANAAKSPLFLQSYASAMPGSDDAIINNFAYVYDNAIAALALTYAGKHDRARQIADAIVYAYQHDRYYSDDRLRNAYSSGDPVSFPGWASAKGEDFARVPGFWDATDKQWYEDYYAVSTSTGNAAWAVLALCDVYKNAPEQTQYLAAAKDIGDFILTLRSETGGFTGGYEGWEPDQTKATYKSTEHNIDLIPAFAQLAALTGDQKYTDASAHAKAFVLSMYDAGQGNFYTGTGDDGVTANKDVLPLDTNTWAILALGDDFKDSAKTLAFIEQRMAVDGGYDFNSDSDGVWMEGTAQTALAYKAVGNEDKYRQILDYLNSKAESDGSITAADRDGVTTGFVVSGTDLPWTYGHRVHVGATAWLAFAQMGVNPLG
ncbi:MAG: hypothetical protein LBN10_11540 [Propionibacteriaceae bacterium]|jgi:hypothetical protein|nr:hypothetical protein [Propionibacteriaceae bacterium]